MNNKTDIFEENVIDFDIREGDKILSKEPYAEELYKLYNDKSYTPIIPNVGDIVEGTVTNMNKDGIARVEFNGKSSAYIDVKKETTQAKKYIKEGIKLDLMVKSNIKSNLIVSFSETIKINKFKEIYNSIDDDTVAYKGKVIDLIQDAGYWVDIDGIQCFLPGSLAGINILADFSSLLGEELHVMPINYAADKDTIVVSHKKYLEALIPAAIDKLEKDSWYEGHVTGTAKFGIFVEFNDCLTGMVHVSDLDKDTKKDFENRTIKPGDSINFKIKDIISKKKIVLTQKDTYDPWVDVNEKYPEGSTVKGKIYKIESYGVFCKLEEGLNGLLAISNPKVLSTFNKGQEINLVVSSIDKENRKMFFVRPRRKPFKNDRFKSKGKTESV